MYEYGMVDEPTARVRWAVNITKWMPEKDEMDFLLTILPMHERERVMRFKREEDRKRALVSRLMQRACVGTCAALEKKDEAEIKRTKGGKPFVYVAKNKTTSATTATTHMGRRETAPNFNFNVSHEGDFVVLASEPVCVVGVDVAAPSQVRKTQVTKKSSTPHPSTSPSPPVAPPLSVDELRRSFGRTCTAAEWDAIARDDEQEAAFRRHWSCKEAFAKARGDGLGLDLQRAEFLIKSVGDTFRAEVRMDGQIDRRWAFHVEELGAGHWVTVARGPPCDVVDAHGLFRASFAKPDAARNVAEWRHELNAPSPPFTLLSISDVVPTDYREGYEAAGGDIL